MPWKEQTPMSQRQALIAAAQQEGANLSALCRQYGVSRKTLYKWLKRLAQTGPSGLGDQSRRPHRSPGQTLPELEALVLGVRRQHPAWGGRKIRRVLCDQGHPGVPASSTITAILRRQGQIDPDEAAKHTPWQRFEAPHPNGLWQMDFKGYFALEAGGYCHPLSVLDDHSRFLVGLRACPNQTAQTVQAQLSAIFERFGLPERMLMDNGSPWGFDRDHRHTLLTAWLIRLGIAISHGRPYHPQTQGKTERFHRTLRAEVIAPQALATLGACQTAFDGWGQVYNYERPHEALQLAPPASRYQASPRPFPAQLPPVSYPAEDEVRKVDISGNIYLQGRRFHISAAFRHQPVAVRPTAVDGVWEVFFCLQKVARISLREDNPC